MDDEKSITAKLTNAISKAAVSVKSAVSHVVDTASDAAQHAMEANAERISRIPAAKAGPEQVAGTTNEQIYIPEAPDAAAMPMPLVPVAPPAKKRNAPSKPARAKTVPAKAKAAPRKTIKKTTKKTIKKTAKKKASANKAATKSANKAAKQRPRKRAKKSREEIQCSIFEEGQAKTR
jgi:hypothetical protein